MRSLTMEANIHYIRCKPPLRMTLGLLGPHSGIIERKKKERKQWKQRESRERKEQKKERKKEERKDLCFVALFCCIGKFGAGCYCCFAFLLFVSCFLTFFASSCSLYFTSHLSLFSLSLFPSCYMLSMRPRRDKLTN